VSLAAVRMHVRYSGVLAALQRLRAPDMLRAYRELRGPARYDQRHHDRRSEGPDGRWPSLAPATIARRRRKRGKDKNGRRRGWPKKLLGRLPVSLRSIATSRSLVVQSAIRRPGLGFVHQKGGRIGRGARVPRRQYLWISDWLERQAIRAFRLALVRSWKAR
jgi:hypothetical protein